MTDLPRPIVARGRGLAGALDAVLGDRGLVLGFARELAVLDLNVADPDCHPGGSSVLPRPVDGVDHVEERWR